MDSKASQRSRTPPQGQSKMEISVIQNVRDLRNWRHCPDHPLILEMGKWNLENQTVCLRSPSSSYVMLLALSNLKVLGMSEEPYGLWVGREARRNGEDGE